MVGQAAIRQALRWEFRLTYADIAWITGVSERTAWNHCNASKSSGVRHWLNRPESEQQRAVAKAREVADSFLDLAVQHDFAPERWMVRLGKVVLS